MDKLIITTAVSGSATFPSQTPYLPLTPEQIADAAVESCQAGSAVVHIHARQGPDGHPVSDPDVYHQILTSIKNRCDAVVCVTTGGHAGLNKEQRLAVVRALDPELASYSLGSLNFAIYPVAKHIKEFKYQWEKDFLETTKDFVFKNTFSDLQYFAQVMKEHGTKPELEAYDVGHLYNAAQLLKDGVLEMPFHLQFVVGMLGGIGASIDNLLYLKSTADKLFGSENYTWSVAGVGYPWQQYLATVALMMGGHARVGLEDNIFVDHRVLAESNVELVSKIVRIAKELGRQIATPDEARSILHLKGNNRVRF